MIKKSNTWTIGSWFPLKRRFSVQLQSLTMMRLGLSPVSSSQNSSNQSSISTESIPLQSFRREWIWLLLKMVQLQETAQGIQKLQKCVQVQTTSQSIKKPQRVSSVNQELIRKILRFWVLLRSKSALALTIVVRLNKKAEIYRARKRVLQDATLLKLPREGIALIEKISLRMIQVMMKLQF